MLGIGQRAQGLTWRSSAVSASSPCPTAMCTPSMRSSSWASTPPSTTLGRKRSTPTASCPLATSRSFRSSMEASLVTSTANPSANWVCASRSPVHFLLDRRRCSGSKRTRRHGCPRKSLNHWAARAPMSHAGTVSSHTVTVAGPSTRSRATCNASMPGARSTISEDLSCGRIKAMRGKVRWVRKCPCASTTIQARSRSRPVSVSTASCTSIPAHDFTG